MRDGAPDGGSRGLSPAPRRGMLLTLAGTAAVVSGACSVPARANIICIPADDLGYGDLSSYGAPAIQTPNIDRLADEGVLHTDAHSPSSLCTPTRYSFLTGRYCWRIWLTRSALRSDGPLLIEEGRPTVAPLLQSAGYFAVHIAKWHLDFGRVWEVGHRVPSVARWPGEIRAGTRSAETASQADLMATRAAVAGEVMPQGAGPDGFNVLPALAGGMPGESALRPRVMHSGGNGMLALREGPWKLVDGQGGGGYQDGEAADRVPPQLYDLDEDLGETRGLSAHQRETARRLPEALCRIRTEGRSR